VKERPLILFTLASQLAVGLFVLAALSQVLSAPAAGSPYPPLVLFAVTPLALLGMLASFLHLSRPLNAWRAVANLRASWLSREILCAAVFAGLSGLYTLVYGFGWGPVALRSGLAWLAALAGLALVYSMGRVYMLRSLPPWRTWLTLASFYATAFLLGILALAPGLPWGESAWLRLAALFCLGVQVLAAAQWAKTQSRPVRHLALKAAYQRPEALPPPLRRWLALRLGLGAAGVALFVLVSPSCSGPLTALSMWLAFALALAGEIIGRSLFYSALE